MLRQATSDEWTDRVSAVRTDPVPSPTVQFVSKATGEVVGRVDYSPDHKPITYWIDEAAVERATLAEAAEKGGA